MISMNFNNYASLVKFFIISVLFCFVFEHWKSLKLRMFISFFLWGFRICSCFNNVNYGARYVYKPLFDSSVATCRLTSVPKFHFQLLEKAKKKSRKSSNIVKLLADGMTASAQLYALYSYRARSFNQWQHAVSELYYNHLLPCIKKHTCSLHSLVHFFDA